MFLFLSPTRLREFIFSVRAFVSHRGAGDRDIFLFSVCCLSSDKNFPAVDDIDPCRKVADTAGLHTHSGDAMDHGCG